MTEARFGVVLGADSLLLPRSGIGRMTAEIAHAVQAHPAAPEIRLLIRDRLRSMEALPEFVAPEAVDRGAVMRGSVAGWLRPFAGNLPGWRRARAARAWWWQRPERRSLDALVQGRVVYHEPNMIPPPFAGPTVVTINDLSWHRYPDMHPADRLSWIARNLPRALSQASRVVAISEFTAAEIVEELGVPRDRIDVVPLAAGAEFRPVGKAEAAETLDRHGLTDQGYVLSVSTLEPRKNFDRLFAAHRALPPSLRQRFPLAIAGGAGWGSVLASASVQAAARDGTLRLLGRVFDADLTALYARAAAVAYLSLYEGFGLPVLEAMASGAPVVASSTSAIGEVAGYAALRVDPLDQDAITEALRRVLEDRCLAASLRAAGLARAGEYSWQQTADCLMATWRRALEPGM